MDEWLGLLRSLAIYWRPGHRRGLERLYRNFVEPGDLVFDIGAHLGDRTAAFSALGARVIALEPNPRLLPWLHRLVGGRKGVVIRAEAVGPASGSATLAMSRRTPTVSTLAHDWRGRIGRTNPSFARVRWEEGVEVPLTTLDALIREYGLPRFCKIDVEGYEARVLQGLSVALPAASMEFVSGSLGVARKCVDRLEELADYEFNAIPGEGRSFLFDRWRSADQIREWLEGGAGASSSGDLYARRVADSRAGSAP